MTLAKTTANLIAVLAMSCCLVPVSWGQAAGQAEAPATAPAKAPATSAPKAPATAPKTAQKKKALAAKAQSNAPAAKAQSNAPAAKAQSNAPAAKAQSKARAAKPQSKAAAPAAKADAKTESVVAKRDPFVPLVNEKKTGGPALPPGKAGLVIATVRVDGTVKAASGMLAVVTNPDQRTYFIREGDRLYDGDVEKIGLDGVTFRENSKDAFGKPVERLVTKRIYPSAGEQQ